MTWFGVVALLAVVVIALLPTRVTARVGALARGGRLGGRGADGVRPRADARSLLGAVGSLSPRAVGLVVAVCCASVGVLVAPVAGVDAAVVLGTTALLTRDARRARLGTERLAEIRSAVGLLEAELQAGSPPASALTAAAAISPRLRAVLAAPGGSGPVGAGRWDAAGALVACNDVDLQRLGVAWRVGESTGVPLADVLGRLAADLRSLADQRRAVSVALAGPRSSAVLLCLLPVLGIALGASMGAHPLALLIGTSSGRMLGCVGLVLDAAGVLWVRHILLRAGRA